MGELGTRSFTFKRTGLRQLNEEFPRGQSLNKNMVRFVYPPDLGLLHNIKDLYFTFAFKDREEKHHVNPLLSKEFSVSEETFAEITRISLTASYKFRSEAKTWTFPKLIWKRGITKSDQKSWMRQNTNTPFTPSKGDIDKILKILDQKTQAVQRTPLIPKGNKNLIYYAVGGKEDYFELLSWSIKTIIENTPSPNFDILFFCPDSWMNKIEALKGNSGINFYYYPVQNSDDGVALALNRLKIFDFRHIDSYAKILYLDSDILAFSDVNKIFELNAEHERFYAVLNCGNITTFRKAFFTHGIIQFDKETIDRLDNANQLPMNTGQFFFLNSNRMRKHITNVRWLQSVWPLEYFFEQCFFNHYFCTNCMGNTSLLADYVFLQQHKTNFTKESKDKYTLVHFAGPPLDSQTKKEYILEQLYAIGSGV